MRGETKWSQHHHSIRHTRSVNHVLIPPLPSSYFFAPCISLLCISPVLVFLALSHLFSFVNIASSIYLHPPHSWAIASHGRPHHKRYAPPNHRMTSYFSSLTSSSAISNLGTRLNSLRRAITLGDEGDDPDHEDCSHISNVLRAYYTEKGRPFPSWLPPDPKAPQPSPARTIATSQIQPGTYGSAPGASAYGRNSGGGLGDLWGDSGAAQPPAAQTASLRRGRGNPGSVGSAPPLTTAKSAPHTPMESPPMQSGSPSLHPAGARPLPSQRAGSYQTVSGGLPGTQPLERAASAQERLRARLHGGRSPSPGQAPGNRPGSPYYGGDPSARKPVGLSGRR